MLNTRLAPGELAWILDHCGAKVLLVDPALKHLVADTRVEHLIDDLRRRADKRYFAIRPDRDG